MLVRTAIPSPALALLARKTPKHRLHRLAHPAFSAHPPSRSAPSPAEHATCPALRGLKKEDEMGTANRDCAQCERTDRWDPPMVKTYRPPLRRPPTAPLSGRRYMPYRRRRYGDETAASLEPPPPLHHPQDHDAKTKRCGRLGTPGRPHAAVRGRYDSARRRPGGWTHFDSGSVALSSCRVGVVLVRKSVCLWSSRRIFVRPSRLSSTSTLTVAPRPHGTPRPQAPGPSSLTPTRHPRPQAPTLFSPKADKARSRQGTTPTSTF